MPLALDHNPSEYFPLCKLGLAIGTACSFTRSTYDLQTINHLSLWVRREKKKHTHTHKRNQQLAVSLASELLMKSRLLFVPHWSSVTCCTRISSWQPQRTQNDFIWRNILVASMLSTILMPFHVGATLFFFLAFNHNTAAGWITFMSPVTRLCFMTLWKKKCFLCRAFFFDSLYWNVWRCSFC